VCSPRLSSLKNNHKDTKFRAFVVNSLFSMAYLLRIDCTWPVDTASGVTPGLTPLPRINLGATATRIVIRSL